MKTIIVPIDSNKEGDLVANKAIEIATAFDANVHLVHVTSIKNKEINAQEEAVEYISSETLSAYEKEMETLNLFKARFSAAGLICETHLLQGAADKQILRLAEKVNADLIILGLINHSTLYKVFVGSVSNEVIKGTKTPILLVPPVK
ncbi:MAG TPA: universal stress protein [Moheibacter sp.]|nr:universal stress protein [Moheibacter sp.]